MAIIASTSQEPSSIIFVFIDGIGLGKADRDHNPFSKFQSYFFSTLGGKNSFEPPGTLIPTDAHMGVEGLPQSATGQMALFTGFNGAEIMGRHISGFPAYSMRPYLKKKSIIKNFLEAGRKATLINSYTDWYLNRIASKRGERLMSASSMMQLGSGLKFFTLDDYLDGRSLYMDITNWFLRRKGIKVPMVAAKETGRKLVRLARDYDLIIYEYFFTDWVGHESGWGAAKRILKHIEDFMEGIWEELDITKELFVLSSDHGNFEDLSHGHHTNNPVPTIIHGKGAESLSKVRYLYDIPKGIMELKGVEWMEEFVT